MKGIAKTLGTYLLAGSLMAGMSGCTGLRLTPQEVEFASRLERAGISKDEQKLVSPFWFIANLLLFPVGNMLISYKANCEGEDRGVDSDRVQAGYLMDIYSWPVSLTWTILDVIKSAKILNTKYIINCYADAGFFQNQQEETSKQGEDVKYLQGRVRVLEDKLRRTQKINELEKELEVLKQKQK